MTTDPQVARRRAGRQVTSAQNPAIKSIRALAMAKARREQGRFTADGMKVVAMARDLGWPVSAFVYQTGMLDHPVVAQLIDWAAGQGADCLEVTLDILQRLAAKENPQTVLGVFPQRWLPLEAVTSEPSALWVVLDAVRDPGNLGTILRTVDAVGATGAILVCPCCDPYSVEAVRATMGSIFSVPLVRTDHAAFLDWVRGWPGSVVGTHLRATTDYRAAAYRDPALLLMGSEGTGLSEALAGACTALVKIPMAGTADLLNVAIATALLLYEIRRDRLSV